MNKEEVKPVRAWAKFYGNILMEVYTEKEAFDIGVFSNLIEVEIRPVAQTDKVEKEFKYIVCKTCHTLHRPPEEYCECCKILESQVLSLTKDNEELRKQNTILGKDVVALGNAFDANKTKLDVAKNAFEHIKTYGGTTCDGVSCNVSWCAEQARSTLYQLQDSPPAVEEKDLGIKDTLKVNENVASPTPLKDGKVVHDPLTDARITFWKIYSITTGKYEHDLEAPEISDNALIQQEAKRMFDRLCELYKPTDDVISGEERFPSKPPASPVSEPKEEDDEYLIYLKNAVYNACKYLRQSEWFNPADILEQSMESFLEKNVKTRSMSEPKEAEFKIYVNQDLVASGDDVFKCMDYAKKRLTSLFGEPKETKEEVSAEECLEWLFHSGLSVTCFDGTLGKMYQCGESLGATPKQCIRSEMKSVKQQEAR